LAAGFGNPLVVVFYELALAALGLHLYHGIWSSGRSLGVSPPSPHPLKRHLALALSVLIWAGFAVIPIAVSAGMVR
jgi:succinate dehydrogenase / fumarate reductase, cytochrome b subunit